ncbi:MAG: hydrogenase maturation protease [Planctomycetes bacterium]|nr:hydrogenase maturation protease [Planctomycetota bacterium]
MAAAPRSGWVGRLTEAVGPRTVIVCVGNTLAGDDGLGPAVAAGLAGGVPWPVLDAGAAPENFLMKIVAHEPDMVLLVDTLAAGAAPGTIRLVEPADLAGPGPSTHGPAPTVFLEALVGVHPCRVVVLGVEPASLATGAPLSPAVARAAETIVAALRSLAGECGPGGATAGG